MKSVVTVSILALLAALPTAVMAQSEMAPVPAEQTSVQAENPELSAVLADYNAFLKAKDPITAGLDGDIAARSLLPDLSREAEIATRAPLQRFKARLDSIDAATLSANDAQNRAFMLFLINRDLEAIELDTTRLALNSEGAIGQSLVYLASITRISTAADAEAWLARLAGMPAMYDATLVHARRGLKTGLIQPRSVVESALTLAQTDAAIAPDADPLMVPLVNLPSTIPVSNQAALRTRAAALIAGGITPRRTE